MVQDKAVWVKHSQRSALLVFPDTESTLHVVHVQQQNSGNSCYISQIGHRHNTPIAFGFSVRLLPLPHINNKSLWNTGKINSAPVPGAPVIVSALIYKR